MLKIKITPLYERLSQSHTLYGNENRLIDTKGMNRTSGKPLKTRDFGTSGVAGIPCLLLGLCQGSMGAVAAHGHSGQKSDPSVTPLTPTADRLTPMAVKVTSVVVALTPLICGR